MAQYLHVYGNDMVPIRLFWVSIQKEWMSDDKFCVRVISKEWDWVGRSTVALYWSCTIHAAYNKSNYLLYCISSIRPGMTAADTHSFPSHSKQISILTYEQSPASHSKGKLEMSTMGGILCTRNGTLPSEDLKVLIFTSHLLPLHPCSELDSISFYWVFIGLRLYPWCFYCLPAFLHSALTCIILFRVHKISGMYLALFLYSQYGINISLWFWG